MMPNNDLNIGPASNCKYGELKDEARLGRWTRKCGTYKGFRSNKRRAAEENDEYDDMVVVEDIEGEDVLAHADKADIKLSPK